MDCYYCGLVNLHANDEACVRKKSILDMSEKEIPNRLVHRRICNQKQSGFSDADIML